MTGRPSGWQASFSQPTHGKSPPKINHRTRLLDFSQITIRLDFRFSKGLSKSICTTWASHALTRSGNESVGQGALLMILAAALALLYLAILCLILVGNAILVWLEIRRSLGPAVTIGEIERAAGETGSAVISVAEAALNEIGGRNGFRFEVTTYVRSSGRLIAVRAILEKTGTEGAQSVGQIKGGHTEFGGDRPPRGPWVGRTPTFRLSKIGGILNC